MNMKKQILSLIIFATVAVMATAQTATPNDMTVRAFTAGGATSDDGSYGVFGQPFAAIQATPDYEVAVGVAQMQIVYDTVYDVINYQAGYHKQGFNLDEFATTDNYQHDKYFLNGGQYNYDLIRTLYLWVCPLNVFDMEDNSIDYGSLALEGYCWTKQNLRTPNHNGVVYNSDQHPESSIPEEYGMLYTWADALNNENPADKDTIIGICPTGAEAKDKWYIPNLTEITVVYHQDATTIRATTGWSSLEQNSNSTGFTAYPAGIFKASANRFEGFGSVTDWWSTDKVSETVSHALEVNYYCNTPMIVEKDVNDKISVRCVQAPDWDEVLEKYRSR